MPAAGTWTFRKDSEQESISGRGVEVEDSITEQSPQISNKRVKVSEV